MELREALFRYSWGERKLVAGWGEGRGVEVVGWRLTQNKRELKCSPTDSNRTRRPKVDVLTLLSRHEGLDLSRSLRSLQKWDSGGAQARALDPSFYRGN